MKTYNNATKGGFRHINKWLALCAVVLLAGNPSGRAQDHPKPTRAPIYDESLDGAKQIDEALAQARKENKRVFIQFGANWCGWCHKLHTLLKTDKPVADKLKSNYVFLLVDVNKDHNRSVIDGYNAAKHGLPVIVVLDADGKQLTTKDTGELEEGDHHDPKKVLAFLEQWAPKRP
ncbi:MAG: thiol:disulfide interchange protein precursor [Pedosphaera sp.]|nr:thiol:disulfide interchange protein precursor [Pedosphaera sp.]